MAIRQRLGAGILLAIGAGAIILGIIAQGLDTLAGGVGLYLIGAGFLFAASTKAVHQFILGLGLLIAGIIIYIITDNFHILAFIIGVLGLIVMALGAISRVRPIQRRRGRKRRPIR